MSADTLFENELESLNASHSNRGHEEEGEGWLVSYADLITLLFIFFGVMLSVSSTSKVKLQLLSEQVNHSTVSTLSQFKKEVEEEIKLENLSKDIQTSLDNEGLQIQFSERLLFPSGEANLNPEGRRIMAKVGEMLKKVDQRYSTAVIGHSDDRPIRTRHFSSNWDLSSKRATNVLHFLIDQGVYEKNLMVRAYASNRPLVPLDSEGVNLEEARARNRRVTLLVF